METAFYNPSSPYGPAIAVEKMLDTCRQMLLERTGGQRVIFTSGGTEANNLAILGHLDSAHRSGCVLFSAGEHPSVREACRQAAAMGFDVKEIPLLDNGVCDMEALESLAGADTVLICLMQVNNETGAIQPLRQALEVRTRKCPGAHVHVDGVQGFLRLPFRLEEVGSSSYTLSAHKIRGPKGIGALVTSGGAWLSPRVYGGGQEGGLRSGTENTPGITGMMKAVETYPASHRMRDMKQLLYNRLRAAIPSMAPIGPDPSSCEAADHILCLSFPPVRSEPMMNMLAQAGVYVGIGSACGSKRQKVSMVLQAMRVPRHVAECAIRFSLGPETDEAVITYAADACIAGYQALKRYTRR